MWYYYIDKNGCLFIVAINFLRVTNGMVGITIVFSRFAEIAIKTISTSSNIDGAK